MFGPLPYPFRFSPLHIIPVFPHQIWNNNQVQDPQCVQFAVFYLFFRCSESWFPFLSFFSSLSRWRNRVLRQGCVWIGPGSFMWYRSDVNGEANGCAFLFDRERALPFSRIAQNGEKKRGDMADRFNNDFLQPTSIDFSCKYFNYWYAIQLLLVAYLFNFTTISARPV